MKRTLFTLLFAMTCAGQTLAADNICSMAGPVVNSTTVQVDTFSDKNNQRTFEGSGKIRDVKSGRLTSKITVVVDCGNDVMVEVPTSSPRVSSSAQIGEPITFSGRLTSVTRKRYVDSHAWYLMVSLDDNSSVW
jgi:hypothetical protein